MRYGFCASILLAAATSLVASAQSTSFKFVSINYPGSLTTVASGINNYGSIVGSYQTSTPGVHGFKLNSGHFTRIDVPGAQRTVVEGISDTGDMVGWYTTTPSGQDYRGFYYHAGKFTTINVPGAAHGTMAMGINKNGLVVGHWLDVPGNYHGFTWRQGTFTKFDLSGNPTSLNGVSNLGVFVGQALSQDSWRSFLKSGSDVDYLVDPREADNEAYGVNGHGDIVGCSVASYHGYLIYNPESGERSESSESLPKRVDIAYPNALVTCATGINYNRSIVGNFVDSHQHQQGFLAVPQ